MSLFKPISTDILIGAGGIINLLHLTTSGVLSRSSVSTATRECLQIARMQCVGIILSIDRELDRRNQSQLSDGIQKDKSSQTSSIGVKKKDSSTIIPQRKSKRKKLLEVRSQKR